MYPTNISHWIDDREVAGSSGASFEKRSPIDDRVIAQVARGNAADARAAVDAAERAAASWSRLTPPRRGEILGRAAALLRATERDFAEIIRLETGKPWKNAAAEVGSSADLAVFMESEGSRFYGKTMPSPIPNRSVRTVRAPIGVCAAIPLDREHVECRLRMPVAVCDHGDSFFDVWAAKLNDGMHTGPALDSIRVELLHLSEKDW